jgi:hypothetical protein
MARKPKSTPPEPVVVEPPPPPVRAWWKSPGLWGTILLLGAFIGGGVAVYQLAPDLRTAPEYQFSMEETRITPPNSWVPKTILQEVLAESKLPGSVSLLDPDLTKTVWEAWSKHPWVKEVHSVEIQPGIGLVVHAEYRAPAAFVEVQTNGQQGFYPVDSEGVLLPPRDFSLSSTELLPRIRNIATLPQGREGEPWGDAAVSAAASLANVLAPEQDISRYWTKLQLKAILAPNLSSPQKSAEQLTFELETAGGNRVVWGKAPGFDALEPTTDVKLARLLEYQNRFGSLDGVNGLHRIDIRLFDGISLQPLGESIYR